MGGLVRRTTEHRQGAWPARLPVSRAGTDTWSARRSGRWRPLVIRRAGAGRTEEQLFAVREGQVRAVDARAPVLGLISLDDDHGSGRQRVLREAAPEQRVWRAGFDHPLLGLAGLRILHIDMDPGMGVDPFHLGDRSREL